MNFYSSIIFIEAFAAIAMITLIARNPVIDKHMRRDYCIDFLLIVVIVTTEWFNIFLNGSAESLRTLHYAVKCLEFCFVPMLPAVAILTFDYFKPRKPLMYLNAAHWGLEIISCFTGWVFYMDAGNNYVRGPLYFVFVVFYMTETGILVWSLVRHGKSYQNNNYLGIITGGLFAISGITLQLFDSEIRTSWLAVEMGFIMSYIYFNDMELQTDKLTGLLNRWCYEQRLASIDYQTAILIFDVDSFKSINDSFGHLVGDECLKTTARLIRKNFSKEGKCYRIGGDEFCVILKKKSKYALSHSDERLNALIEHFSIDVRNARKADPRFTNISVGYAFTDPDFSINWAIEKADRQMYDIKVKNKAVD